MFTHFLRKYKEQIYHELLSEKGLYTRQTSRRYWLKLLASFNLGPPWAVWQFLYFFLPWCSGLRERCPPNDGNRTLPPYHSFTLLTPVPSNLKFLSHISHSGYLVQQRKGKGDVGRGDRRSHVSVRYPTRIQAPWQVQTDRQTNTCVAFRALVNIVTSSPSMAVPLPTGSTHSPWHWSNAGVMSAEGTARHKG